MARAVGKATPAPGKAEKAKYFSALLPGLWCLRRRPQNVGERKCRGPRSTHRARQGDPPPGGTRSPPTARSRPVFTTTFVAANQGERASSELRGERNSRTPVHASCTARRPSHLCVACCYLPRHGLQMANGHVGSPATLLNRQEESGAGHFHHCSKGGGLNDT